MSTSVVVIVCPMGNNVTQRDSAKINHLVFPPMLCYTQWHPPRPPSVWYGQCLWHWSKAGRANFFLIFIRLALTRVKTVHQLGCCFHVLLQRKRARRDIYENNTRPNIFKNKNVNLVNNGPIESGMPLPKEVPPKIYIFFVVLISGDGEKD